MREQSEKPDGTEDDDSDDDDSDDEIDEELGYISPLDTVDPYVTFKQALGSTFSPPYRFVLGSNSCMRTSICSTAFEAQNPQMYQLATTSLNIEQQTQLMEIIRQAEQNATTPQA